MIRLPEHTKPHRDRGEGLHWAKSLLRKHGLLTVCESARCPNIGECFGRKVATFMIMGDLCTRTCSFCAVGKGEPLPLDPDEPRMVSQAAKGLGLKHVVVTSVTRDDLEDGGAFHFARTIEEIRRDIPDATVEVLIPDFEGNNKSLETIINARPDVLNHNIETVPRLYPDIRPQADYRRSLELLERAHNASLITKSGLMLGMGEEFCEVIGVMEDLRVAGCDVLTLGQYLRPTRSNRPVDRYLEPHEFDACREKGLSLGFKTVFAGPLVRSSYRADEMQAPMPQETRFATGTI